MAKNKDADIASAEAGTSAREESSSKVSRRTLLQTLSIAFGACAISEIPGCAPGDGNNATFDDETEFSDDELTVSKRITVVRARDLLSLTIGLSNLKSTPKGDLVRVAAGDSYIVLDFPPQAILEEALGQTPDGSFSRLSHVADTRMSGPSRLAFLLPDKFTTAPYTLESILALCSTSELKLPGVTAKALKLAISEAKAAVPTLPKTMGLHPFAAAAIDRATSSIDASASLRLAMRAQALGDTKAPVGVQVAALTAQPNPIRNEVTTFVEMPFRVLLAPTTGTAFSHTTKLPADAASTELWHTRLCARNADGSPDPRRAAPASAGVVWVRDEVDAEVDSTLPGNASLSPKQRRDLYRQAPYSPDEGDIELERMMLSAMGGSLLARAEFPSSTTLNRWIHKMAWGREYYVEAASSGYLMPFGHKAIKTDITSRNEDPSIAPIGTMIKYSVISVHNPLVRFGGNVQGQEDTDYPRPQDFPFAAVELVRTSFMMPGTLPRQFLIQIGKDNGLYPAIAYDQGGNAVKFDVPLYFFTSDDGSDAQLLLTDINGKLALETDLAGQRIKYAKSGLDDTTYETSRFKMQLRPLAAPLQGTYSASPYVEWAKIKVDAIARVTGQGTDQYKFHPTFLSNGLDPTGNAAQLIWSLYADGSKVLQFNASPESSTGFVRPDMQYSAISRTNGAVQEVVTPPAAKAAAAVASAESEYATFDPASYFGAGDLMSKALLFGTIPLVNVLETITPDSLKDELIKDPLHYAPKFISDALSEVESFIRAFVNLQAQLGNLHKQAREELQRVKDNLSNEAKTLLKDDIDKYTRAFTHIQEAIGNDDKSGLFGAVSKLLTDIQDFSAKETPPVGDDVDAIFKALKNVTDSIAELQQVPQVGLTEAMGSAVGFVDGVMREFEKAKAAIAGWEGHALDVVNLYNTAHNGFETLKNQTLRLEWRPILKSFGNDLVSFTPLTTNALLLSIETRAKAQGDKPAGVDFSARLDRFHLHLGKLEKNDPSDPKEEGESPLTLKFKHLEVKQLAKRKPDCDLVFEGLSFGGKLKFIQTLTDIIPRDGFSDPPYIKIEGGNLKAGFTLAIPDLAMGVFAVQNMAVGAEVNIPLFGIDPMKFSFNFCSKESPFLVTVAMLGGGGYFKFSMDIHGNLEIEGSICVAASLAIDLFIASASVTISAGIFFSIAKNSVTIGGFLCIHGQCDVLGIITISIDLRMELFYEDGDVVGRATITVDVHVLFFSKSVSLTFEKRFAGPGRAAGMSTFVLTEGGAQPTLRQAMGQVDDPKLTDQQRYDDWAWKEYVYAFA